MEIMIILSETARLTACIVCSNVMCSIYILLHTSGPFGQKWTYPEVLATIAFQWESVKIFFHEITRGISLRYGFGVVSLLIRLDNDQILVSMYSSYPLFYTG